MNPEGEI